MFYSFVAVNFFRYINCHFVNAKILNKYTITLVFYNLLWSVIQIYLKQNQNKKFQKYNRFQFNVQLIK